MRQIDKQPDNSDRARQAMLLIRIENVFIKTLQDLKDPVILGGIDCHPGGTEYRIRSHDFYGPLPDIDFRFRIDEYDEALLKDGPRRKS